MSITAALRDHARIAGSRPALILDDDAIAWSALDAAVDRLAGLIRARGARGIALDLPNCPALVLMILAAARAGAEAQVLDPAWPAVLRNDLLGRLGSDLLVTARVDPAPAPTVQVSAGWTFRDVADILAAPPASLVAEPDTQKPFYTGFTSGSTGRPKGYRRHHASWLASFAAEAHAFGTSAADTVLVPGSLTHSLGVYALCSALHHGATCVLSSSFRPDRAADAIRRHGVTLMHSVPTIILLIAEEAARGSALAGVRMITSSGARLPPDLRRRVSSAMPNAELAEFYGASELSFVTVARAGDPAGSVGHPFPGVEIAIRDRRGRRLPTGRRGTVFVTSPFAFIGYATGEGGPERHGDAVSVGDRGFLDAAGRLHLVGRGDRMAIIAGRNVHPEGIEATIAAHPLVEAVAVFAVPDHRRGERLAAFVQCGEGLTRRMLSEHLRTGAGQPVPHAIRRLADWPRTTSGKTDFAALRCAWDAGQGTPLP